MTCPVSPAAFRATPCRRSLAGSGGWHRQSPESCGATPPPEAAASRIVDDSAMARRARCSPPKAGEVAQRGVTSRTTRPCASAMKPSIKRCSFKAEARCAANYGLPAHRARVADAEGAHARARQDLDLPRDHPLPPLISQRPAEAANRAVPGHREETVLGLGGSAIGTLVERTTRFTLLLYLPRMAGHSHEARVKNGPPLAGHGAEAVRDAITRTIVTLPEQLRRSLTWDQGAEMAQHARLKIEAGVRVYFCDPHSPWQRAPTRTLTGCCASTSPKGPISACTAPTIAAVAAALNSRPRKTLDWKTPQRHLTGFSYQPQRSCCDDHRIHRICFDQIHRAARRSRNRTSVGSVGDSSTALAETIIRSLQS